MVWYGPFSIDLCMHMLLSPYAKYQNYQQLAYKKSKCGGESCFRLRIVLAASDVELAHMLAASLLASCTGSVHTLLFSLLFGAGPPLGGGGRSPGPILG